MSASFNNLNHSMPVIQTVNYAPHQISFISDVLTALVPRMLDLLEERGITFKVQHRAAAQVEILKFRATETIFEIAFIAPKNNSNKITFNLYRHTDRFKDNRGERETVSVMDFALPTSLNDIMDFTETMVERYMIPSPLSIRFPKARFVAELDRPITPSPYAASAFRIAHARTFYNEQGVQMVEIENDYGNVVKTLEASKALNRGQTASRLVGMFYVEFFDKTFFIKSETVFDQGFIVAGKPSTFGIHRPTASRHSFAVR